MRSVPHRFMHLNTCSPTGNTVWVDYGTFRTKSLSGGRTSLGVTSEGLKPQPTSCSLFSASCLWMKIDSVSFLLQPHAALSLLPLCALSLCLSEMVSQNKFFCKLLLFMVFYHIRKIANIVFTVFLELSLHP